MRYFDLRLTPESGGLHPADRDLAAVPEVARESLLHVDAFGDGTGVLLYRLEGDRPSAREFADHSDDVLGFDLIDVDEEKFHLYLHVTRGEPAGSLMALCHDFALIIDTPIRITDHGDVLVTVVGRHDMLREALRNAPDPIDINIEQVGRYRPDEENFMSLLTDRQREVFERAVELGYYDIPRGVNQQELADDLGCAPSTVDEHLRKAESKMLSALLHAPADG
ncbi:helix-turn-helix domain-containing protein [Halorarius halobius]|uniref:helix-turn-helix domain-containing protein n=1 Tax=Halorarius halobius TaxID=2962671 RepID=UPI0020CC760B|nr:helix-turn-helix domain-containing protein [Halorarius halobius]